MKGPDKFTYSSSSIKTGWGKDPGSRSGIKNKKNKSSLFLVDKNKNNLVSMSRTLDGFDVEFGMGLGQSNSYSTVMSVDRDLFNSTISSPNCLIGYPTMKAFPK